MSRDYDKEIKKNIKIKITIHFIDKNKDSLMSKDEVKDL